MVRDGKISASILYSSLETSNSFSTKAAEDHVCNFTKSRQLYYDKRDAIQIRKIADHIRKLSENPDLIFEYDPSQPFGFAKEYQKFLPELVHRDDDFRTMPDNIAPDPWIIHADGNLNLVSMENIGQTPEY